MSEAARKYRQVLEEFLLARALEDGLSDQQEAEFAVRLDKLWWELSQAEQDAIEREIAARRPPSAPIDLGEEDVAVVVGSRDFPRKPV